MFCFTRRVDRQNSDNQILAAPEAQNDQMNNDSGPSDLIEEENEQSQPETWVQIDDNDLKYIDVDEKSDQCPRASVDSDVGLTSDSPSLSGQVEYELTSSFSQKSSESLKNVGVLKANDNLIPNEKNQSKLLQNNDKNHRTISNRSHFFQFPTKMSKTASQFDPNCSKPQANVVPPQRNRSARWKKRISATRRQLRLSPRSSTSNSTSSSANNSRSSSVSRDMSKVTGMLIENCTKAMVDPLKIDVPTLSDRIKKNVKANSEFNLSYESERPKFTPNFSSASNLTCLRMDENGLEEVIEIKSDIDLSGIQCKQNKIESKASKSCETLNPMSLCSNNGVSKMLVNNKSKVKSSRGVGNTNLTVDLSRVPSSTSLYGLSTSSGDISAQSTPTSSSSSIRQSSIESNGSGMWPPLSPGPLGPRFKLLHEGDMQVCYLNHTRTVISKILSSRFLRRWESHHLYLLDTCIASKTAAGFLEQPVSYSTMQEVYVVARWDAGHKFCLRIVVPDGSILLQAGNAYTRDQWYHSIVWKKNLFKYRNILTKSTRQDVILKELKGMVDFATTTPLQDECVISEPIAIISELLGESESWCLERTSSDALLHALSPLLENSPPSAEMCRHFAHHCLQHPRSPLVADALAHIVLRILKHNVDFSRAPHMRLLVQQFLRALNAQNGSKEVIGRFVASVHGPASTCPHPRVLPNLVSVCLAAIFSYYENIRSEAEASKNNINSKIDEEKPCKYNENKIDNIDVIETPIKVDKNVYRSIEENINLIEDKIDVNLVKICSELEKVNNIEIDNKERDIAGADLSATEEVCCGGTVELKETEPEEASGDKCTNVKELEEKSTEDQNEEDITMDGDRELLCYVSVFEYISEYEDWIPGLSLLLQPLPFPEDALCHPLFLKSLLPVIMKIATDKRCSVHTALLGVRDGKDGWFNIYCPSNNVCPDDGDIWCKMLGTLLACCGRRKRFLNNLLASQISACLLLALRGRSEAQEVLGLILEWNLSENTDQRVQIATTLQSTESGMEVYSALCQKQQHLKELQQKGGPKKLTLPSRSTDDDVTKLLSSGSFGNLECLSLAFTHVTSACAEQIIKLPSLRYLNLWATQFGDSGIQLIAEHLQQLQVLNLCETQVTDQGILTLASLSRLRKLNLNSTKLSASTLAHLRSSLPQLQECDVRYTEAW